MHTAEIFRDIKKTLPGAEHDPDLIKIEKIGKVGNVENDSMDMENGNLGVGQENNFNRLMPREFLKRIPGVTSNNINYIAKEVKNMMELVRMPEE